jgi:hypothetical protein
MLRRDLLLRLVLLVGILVLPAQAFAQPAGARPLPPGHPMTNDGVVPAGPLPSDEPDDQDGDDAPLPPGHPATPATHGRAAQGGAQGMFEPPPDTEHEDPALPKGTIEVELRDADNNILAGIETTLGILHQSVAKGESREHKSATSDAKGFSRFDGLETGSGIAYRVTVGRDGATFAALPFQLPETTGMRVVLHVYQVSRDINVALVVMQGILFVEVKDDRIQVEQVFTVFNLGRVTWVPDDVILKLPDTFTALSSQQAMSDQGVDSVEKKGGRLHGTFSPGRHEVHFHWQLPYAGEKDVDFEVGLPPHVAVMRVMAGASTGVKLVVVGFPDAEAKTGAQGDRILVTEKQVKRDEPWTSLHVKLEGLPTAGPGKYIASGLAGLAVAVGFVFAFGGGGKPSRSSHDKSRRAQLLAELLELENARKAGDVGPKTYERARRDLIDAIARTLDAGEPAPKA